MSEQIKFPFKKEEDEKQAYTKVFKGKMPTIEDDEELTKLEGGEPTSEQKIHKAKEKASQEFWERVEKEKKD